MAAADVIERWTVLVDHEDEEKMRTYKLANTTRVQEVKDMWCESVGESPDSVALVKMDGTRPPSEHTLLEVGESYPGSRNITLKTVADHREAAATVLVELYKADSFRERLEVLLSAPPEHLYEDIRLTFRIPSDRQLRLLSDEKPLSCGASLREQDVEDGSLLKVDLLYKVEVKESCSGNVVRHLVFGSYPSEMLLEDASNVPQRLMCGRHVVDVGGEIVDSLRALGGLAQSTYRLRLELRHDVTVALNDLSAVHVWPLDRVKSLIPAWARSPASAAAVFDSEPVPWPARLSSVNLPAGGLLHCAPVCVRVRTSDGKVRSVRVPRLGSVADVKEAVRGQEEATHFDLRHRGRVLEEDESLVGAGVSPGDLLEVEPAGLALTVTLRDRAMRWRTHRRSLRFGELMEEVSRWGSVEYETLLDRTLRCTGCGRRVWGKEEAFQAVPAPCCHVRSLELEEPTARWCATQTATASRRSATSVQASPESANRGAQAVAFWHQAGTQTEGAIRAVANTGAQTEVERRRSGQQHPPPPPPAKRPFVIRDGIGGRWRPQRKSCDLLLGGRPTVGEVRDAVAQKLEVEPAGVELQRIVGRREGEDVFAVCDIHGNFPMFGLNCDFGNEAGEVRKGGGQLRPLPDDAELFPLVPGRVNVVDARPR